MILLSFLFNRELMNFKVIGKELYYCDRIFKSWIRCIPRDDDFIKKVKLSRNRLPSQLITMFNLSKKDKAEYDECKTEEDVAERVISDCVKKGVKLISKRVVDDVVIQTSGKDEDKDEVEDKENREISENKEGDIEDGRS